MDSCAGGLQNATIHEIFRKDGEEGWATTYWLAASPVTPPLGAGRWEEEFEAPFIGAEAAGCSECFGHVIVQGVVSLLTCSGRYK